MAEYSLRSLCSRIYTYHSFFLAPVSAPRPIFLNLSLYPCPISFTCLCTQTQLLSPVSAPRPIFFHPSLYPGPIFFHLFLTTSFKWITRTAVSVLVDEWFDLWQQLLYISSLQTSVNISNNLLTFSYLSLVFYLR